MFTDEIQNTADDADIVFQHHGFIRDISPKDQIYITRNKEKPRPNKKSGYIVDEAISSRTDHGLAETSQGISDQLLVGRD